MTTFARLQQVDALVQSGNIPRARAELMKLVSKEPTNAAVLNAIAVVHSLLGELDRALYYSESAQKYAPANASILRTYGNLLGQLNKLDQAASVFDRIISIAPMDAGSWLGRSSIERMRENLEGAVEFLRRGISTAGEQEILFEALVAALNNAGHPQEALDLCCKGLEKYPDSLSLAALACNTSHNVESISREDAFRFHVDYGTMMARKFPPPQVRYLNRLDTNRRLRIGLVSSDIRRHSVAFFIEPLLRYADRDQLEIRVYSTSREFDAVSERIKSLAHSWKDASSLADAQLAAAIYADQVDVLIDLHGHTQGHRLGMFHNKPAPVQMTYLGYPDTTGLAAIDYRIVDSHTDPVGATESVNTENLLRIDPCFLCYTPPPEIPALAPRPERPVTFGCFNALHKLSDFSIELWSKVLAVNPGSRMVIKCPVGSQSLVSGRLLGRFGSHGIDASRIDVLPVQKSLHDHLNAYQQMDIALDPYPYHGTTTTCEALMMGVPVVTLAGDVHIRRVGVSVLSAAGYGDWIAKSQDDYVAIATRLAADPAAISVQRERVRPTVLASSLCDGPALAKRMTAAFRTAWVSWCRSQGTVA